MHDRPNRPPGIRWFLALGAAALLLSGVVTPGSGSPVSTHVDRAVASSLSQARLDVERLLPITDSGERPPVTEPEPKPAQPYRRDFPAVARRAAQAAGIRDPELFVRQIAAESAYDPCVYSSAGAIGIAQIMPTTADSWGVDPHDPDAALAEAARRMATYERQLGSYRLALAAYNAGPGAVKRYKGVPPYSETRAYIALITDTSRRLSSTRKVFQRPAGYDRTFAKRLRTLLDEVERRGGDIRVVSGFRSYPEQLRLWKAAVRKHGFRGARAWVAPPGCSNHNRGVAADLRGSLELAHALAPRMGLVFPMAREPWHVEMRGIATQSN